MLNLKEWNASNLLCTNLIFPLNIVDYSNVSDEVDFCAIIDKLMLGCANASDASRKYGFIWVDSIKYCGAEFAIYNYLQKIKSKSNISLYYFSLDQQEFNLPNDIERIQNESGEYIADDECAKIFIFDHAEAIVDPQEIINLSKELCSNKVKNALFIFLSKLQNFESNFWKKVLDNCDTNADTVAIKRAKHFRVCPFTNDQLKKILNEATDLQEGKKQKLIEKVEEFEDYLRCAYFLDRFIYYILKDNNPVPEDFKSFSLLLSMYEEMLDNIFANQYSSDSSMPIGNDYCITFESYINECNNRIQSIGDAPIKQFVWAYGIKRVMQLSPQSTNILKQIFSRIFIEYKSRDEQFLVFEKIYDLLQDQSNIKSYFQTLIDFELWGAIYSLKIIYKNWETLNKIINVNELFVKACQLYTSDIKACPNFTNCIGKDSGTCQGEIKPRFLLGLAIGTLLPYISNNVIESSLGHIFKEVAADYVLPQWDKYSGMSACPITNFEYKKFVEDGGYDLVRLPDVAEVRQVYYELYEELIGIITDAANTDDQKLRRRVAQALRGVDWTHYNMLAQILRGMQKTNGEIIALRKVLQEYYEDNITVPVKWGKKYNPNDNFCNPLQPVVGISLFEAQAYADWLSKKSGKKIRLVKYNPDYIKVVGVNSANCKTPELISIRNEFNEYKSESLLPLINIRDNMKCYYGPYNSGDQGPAPVGLLSQYKLNGSILDFLGNIYEMQTTEYSFDRAETGNAVETIGWQKVYNCSGGGWQHSSANLPTDYMGQFTALTRNQDIGFRIIIEQDDSAILDVKADAPTECEKGRYKKDVVLNSFLAQDCDVELCKNQIDLNKISLKHHLDKEKRLFSSKTFIHKDDCSVIKFYALDEISKFPQEAIMLYTKGYEIFAYHLLKISSATVNALQENGNIQVVKIASREPILPVKSRERKNWSNRERSAKIEILEIETDNINSWYLANSIDIVCGRFKIEQVKASEQVNHLLGVWDIDCVEEFETSLLDNVIKRNLGAEFFMPDWIDIFKIIDLMGNNTEEISNVDTNTTMTILSTIDTADLHKLINTKRKN